ncbi:MAG: membrane protein insertase YidC [Candidatus Pacebacteria bacterium]|nr:membrane protein insertase YidC [Candidatus Paceibacterota bacterium]
MLAFFHEYLYVPIYNFLIYLVGVLPGADVGLAVIMVTLVVKVVTMPLSFSALKTQRAMKEIEPLLKELKEKYKDDKEKQAKEMFALYKEYGIKPFSSILMMFIQIPIVISLFLVFQKEPLDKVNPEILYSFIQDPGTFSPLLFGIFLISGHHLVLALLAGVTQLIQAHYAIPVPPKSEKTASTPESMQAEFGRALAIQARYILPVVIAVVAYASGAIALYLITSNLVGILQEFIVRKKNLRGTPVKV